MSDFKIGDRVRPRPGATFSEPTTKRIQAADGIGVVTETDVEMWDFHADFGSWSGGFWADDFEVAL